MLVTTQLQAATPLVGGGAALRANTLSLGAQF
jgi:hypothetical protein